MWVKIIKTNQAINLDACAKFYKTDTISKNLHAIAFMYQDEEIDYVQYEIEQERDAMYDYICKELEARII